MRRAGRRLSQPDAVALPLDGHLADRRAGRRSPKAGSARRSRACRRAVVPPQDRQREVAAGPGRRPGARAVDRHAGRVPVADGRRQRRRQEEPARRDRGRGEAEGRAPACSTSCSGRRPTPTPAAAACRRSARTTSRRRPTRTRRWPTASSWPPSSSTPTSAPASSTSPSTASTRTPPRRRPTPTC